MSSFQDAIARKRALVEAAKSSNAKPDALATKPKEIKQFTPPSEAENRIRIVFDNSGSMSHPLNNAEGKSSNKVTEAKKGVVEYLRNCSLNKDAVAIHLLTYNYREESDDDSYDTKLTAVSDLIKNSDLCTDLIRLASVVDSDAIYATGGTPLYQRLMEALKANPQATRIIAFSDGQADGTSQKQSVIDYAVKNKIPIDTVFFGRDTDYGAIEMKHLAEATNGIYLAFDPAKGVNFAQAFKYLTPGKRLMLMNAEFKAKLERGEVR